MTLLSTQGLGLAFGVREIFSGINVNLTAGDKVGLVGPNGAGKTSILRMLAGVTEPSAGSVQRSRGLRLGYLRQEAIEAFAGREHSVYDEMREVFAHLQQQAAQLRIMEDRMASGTASEALLAEYGAAQEAFEHGGGYDYEVRIQQVLEGLGFPASRWGTPLGYLSGGQKTRALLARLLLEQPMLLILDEPTNHLDMQAVAWLEKTLHDWQGTLLVVSHDRYFLDNVVNRVWELTPDRMDTYRGNYSAYLRQRQERWEHNQKIFESEMERLEKEMEIIRRYHAWRKYEEAEGRLKRLGRELKAIERFGILGARDLEWSEVGIRSARVMGVDEAHRRIKEIRPPASRPPVLHMHLAPASRSGDIVLRTAGLEVGYEGKPLVVAGDLRLDRLERVAVIGPNGSGKTTFLRTLVRELPPVAGDIQLGGGVVTGYFAQAHDSLEPDNTVLAELMRHRDISPAAARNHLARYLFRGEDVFQPVGALSGGERARLALAILAHTGVNCLLLDEPTNHLDIAAQEVLQEGLEHFDGSMLLVSHDRYLVDQLATQIWEVREGRLHVFKGTYQEFLAVSEQPVGIGAVEKPAEKPADRQLSAEKAERRRVRNLAILEAQIAEAEAMLAQYTAQLQEGSADGDYGEVTRLSNAYVSTQQRVETLLKEWEALSVD